VKALRRSTRYRGIVRTIYVTGYQKFFRDEVPSIVIAPDGIGDTRGAQLFPSPLTLYPPCFRKFWWTFRGFFLWNCYPSAAPRVSTHVYT